ncbi:unnamed protein product, partial [Iphiclides podalirius]
MIGGFYDLMPTRSTSFPSAICLATLILFTAAINRIWWQPWQFTNQNAKRRVVLAKATHGANRLDCDMHIRDNGHPYSFALIVCKQPNVPWTNRVLMDLARQ